MRNLLKILALSLVLTVPAFTITACSDDNIDEPDKPEIFWELEDLLPLLDSASNEQAFVSAISTYLASDLNQRELAVACRGYQESLSNTKNSKAPEHVLATNQTNSGYYKAMYILLNDQYKRADKLGEGAIHAFEELFKSNPGCQDILNHASKEGKRG